MSKIILNECNKKIWSDNCCATEILNLDSLHVYHEMMTSSSSDIIHFHKNQNQFIFVINGQLTLIVDNQTVELNNNEGYLLKAGTLHNFKNNSEHNVTFLTISDNNLQDRKLSNTL